MSAPKIGVYLCSGCGLGDGLDLGQCEAVAKEQKVAACKKHDCLCNDDGVKLIADDVANEGVNRVIIGACSPRMMTDRFNFDGAMTVRANLREQVLWTHDAGDEDTTAIAKDYVRMACIQAKASSIPEAWIEGEYSEAILVVGGGYVGLTAAKEAAMAGYKVVLVERSDQLGGNTRKWSKVMPHLPPYREPQDNPVDGLIKTVEGNSKITVMTNTTVAKTAGMPGKFTVDLNKAGTVTTETVGSIVVATGWRPYDPNKLGDLGYGKPDVVTNVELETMLANGGVKKKDGSKPRTVAFIQCAGSRDPNHLPYCSSVCCGVSIKHAMQLIDNDPETMCYVLFKELRTPGTAEEFYRAGQEKGVIFIKADDIKSVDAGKIVYEDALLGGETAMEGLDMIVLATGMVPNATNIELPTQELEDEQLVVLHDDVDPMKPFGLGGAMPEYRTPDHGIPDGASILNLQYRQGPHIPMLADGFPDSHYICFPYETRRTGIYTCGPVRRPMDMGEAGQDALGAVLKAIQCIRAIQKGRALHPRAGDLSYPKFGLDICTKCRRCTVECPFGAIDERSDDYPVLNPTRCRRCGTCMGACPVRTIKFDNYSVAMINEMAKSVEIPDEFEEKPRVLILACENDAYPAIDMAGVNRIKFNAHVRIIPVRCLGSISLLNISEALSIGYDGVMLMGCKSGDHYQCHFVKGSAIAKERMSKIEETLRSMALEAERVSTFEVAISESHNVPKMIDKFMAKIDEIGLNPFKGF